MKTKYDDIKTWNGSVNIYCLQCSQDKASLKYKPFCSERCFDNFHDHAPIKLIHELYDRIKELKKD